jgi:hypothetical protein
MAMTVRSSIRVKPGRRRGVMENRGGIGEKLFYESSGLVEQSKTAFFSTQPLT